MALDSCEACNTLEDISFNTAHEGIGDAECASLRKNFGLNQENTPLHDNCQDMAVMLDCLIGQLIEGFDMYDICDWKEPFRVLVNNMYNLIKARDCSDCGQWDEINKLWEETEKLWEETRKLWQETEKLWTEINRLWTEIYKIWNYIYALEARITNLESRMTAIENRVTTVEGHITNIYNILSNLVYPEGFVTITKVHRATCDAAQFGFHTTSPNDFWAALGFAVSFDVSEFDIVDGVWVQPRVVGNAIHPVTTLVQTAERVGNNFIVDIDVYEITGRSATTAPFSVPIDYFVIGRKRV